MTENAWQRADHVNLWWWEFAYLHIDPEAKKGEQSWSAALFSFLHFYSSWDPQTTNNPTQNQNQGGSSQLNLFNTLNGLERRFRG